jgi:hypothetical protein
VNYDDAEAATLKLLASLPQEFHGLWYTISQLTHLIRDGRVPCVPRSTVRKVVHADKIMFKRNRWRNTSYFMIGTPKKPGLSPKKQKQYDAEILGFLPLMPEKYFKEKPELKHTVSMIKSHFALKSNLTTRSTTSVTVNDPFCQPVNNDDKPEGLTKLQMGLVILDLDLDVEWMNHVVEHVLKCKKAKLDVLENKLFGAEIVTTYQC